MHEKRNVEANGDSESLTNNIAMTSQYNTTGW
jgi:hypothetical protein